MPSLLEALLVNVIDSFLTLKQGQGRSRQPDNIECSDQFVGILLERLVADKQMLIQQMKSPKTGFPCDWLPLAGYKIFDCFCEYPATSTQCFLLVGDIDCHPCFIRHILNTETVAFSCIPVVTLLV